MGNICIIPARGGSKRIPRKNIKSFVGKPIISYSINAAQESGLFDEVMVSTDDQDIAEIAIKYGAEVPFLRSAQNADDFATTKDVIDEVIAEYENVGRRFAYCCCLYPTAPFVKPQHLGEGYRMLRNGAFDSVFPVVEFGYPIWRSLKREEGLTVMHWPEFITSRSQDLPKAYHDAGQWYWIDLQKISGSLFTKNTHSIVLSNLEVQDIDTDEDWKLAEIKYELLQSIK